MAATVRVKTLRDGVTTPREGSREVDRHEEGAVIEVPSDSADRLIRLGAAEKTTAKLTADKD